jgi:hypothetical protein
MIAILLNFLAMKTLVSLIAFLVLIQINLLAQPKYLFSKDYWHYGEVQMASGKKMPGYIKYQLDDNVISFKNQAQGISTIASSKIKNFTIFDTLTKVNRRFCVLPVNQREFGTKSALFEVIYEGTISLVSREKIIDKPYRSTTQPKTVNQTYRGLEDDFYLVNERGKLKKFTNEQTLALVVKDDLKAIKDFIKSNQLNLQNRKDFATLISHYDQIVSKQLEKSNEKPAKEKESEVNLTER